MNNVVLMGRLTKAPELRHTNDGKAVCSFCIAVDRYGKSTDFFDIVAWEKTAQTVAQYFEKGRMIAINGRLQNRNWTDKNGNKRYDNEIIATNVYFCGDKPKDNFEEIKEEIELPF